MASSDPAISLCMIVRDEEPRLARCLASVAGVVDERVLVDTGSRDRTVELARELGARVVEAPWRDDFAGARNRSLDEARGDWVLVLDADEALVEPAAPAERRARLLAFARAASAGSGGGPGGSASLPPAGQLELVSDQGGSLSRTLVTRFFPRLEGLRYARRIHEALVHAGRPVPGRPTGVAALHTGYRPDELARKGTLARNEALLRAQLEDAPGDAPGDVPGDVPGDGHDWYQLGRVLELGGRFEQALSAYERAVERVRDDDPHLPHLFECAASCLRALGRSAQALAFLAPLEEPFAGRPDTVCLLALLAMDVGQLERAERGFLRCLELGSGPPRATAAPSSDEARGLAPAHNLGVLYECSGRAAEARAAYERALSLRPDHAPSRAGLERLVPG